MTNFYEMQQRFLLKESYLAPDMHSYIQALEEALGAMTPSSVRDNRRLAVAKENLRNIRRQNNKLQTEYKELQERIVQLEETTKRRK